jgi:hypothetical protein
LIYNTKLKNTEKFTILKSVFLTICKFPPNFPLFFLSTNYTFNYKITSFGDDFDIAAENFFIPKNESKEYSENFDQFFDILVKDFQTYFYSEQVYLFNCYQRFTTIIKDACSVPTLLNNKVKIESQYDAESYIAILQTMIKAEYFDYLENIKYFQEEFDLDLKTKVGNKLDEKNKWRDGIYLYTSSKINELTNHYKDIFYL